MAVYRVQKRVIHRDAKGKPQAPVWETIATKHDPIDAKRTARHAQIDNPKATIRVETNNAGA